MCYLLLSPSGTTKVYLVKNSILSRTHLRTEFELSQIYIQLRVTGSTISERNKCSDVCHRSQVRQFHQPISEDNGQGEPSEVTSDIQRKNKQ